MYILEGNIGAGKSTLITLLEHHFPQVSLCQEPTHKWHNTGPGQSLLGLFYERPVRWSFTIETLAMISRVRHYVQEREKQNPLMLMERSIFSGYYCFAKYGHDHGFLTDIEWEIHNQWFEFLTTKKSIIPQGFVYIKTDPVVAYRRIQKRKRSSERSITREYIQSIHEYHEQFLVHKRDVSPELQRVPVLVLDGNHEFETSDTHLGDYVDAIEKFFLATIPMDSVKRAVCVKAE